MHPEILNLDQFQHFEPLGLVAPLKLSIPQEGHCQSLDYVQKNPSAKAGVFLIAAQNITT
jgi:hypothetical protein